MFQPGAFGSGLGQAPPGSVVLFPAGPRPPGGHASRAVWVPPWATHATLTVRGRPGWGRLRYGQDVLAATLEVDRSGHWELLAALTADARPKRDRQGNPLEHSAVRVPLPPGRIPQPQVRARLDCASACPGEVELTFDDGPLPVRPAFEHHSVAVAGTPTETSGTNVTSLTFAQDTTGTGADYLSVGAGGWDGADNVQPSGVTFNSDALTHVGSQPSTPAADDTASLWGRVAPAIGNHNVVVSFGGTISEAGAGAVAMSGVDPATPTGTVARTANDDTPANIAISSSSTGELCIAAYYANYFSNDPPTEGSGQDARFHVVPVDFSHVGGSTKPGAAGTVTITWSATGGNWDAVGCAIKAASAPAAAPKLLGLMGVGK